MPNMFSFLQDKDKHSNVWQVSVCGKPAKDGLYFAVEAFTIRPHNRRKYPILKRDKLEEIFEEAQFALYYRDLMYRDFIPCERVNLENAIERIPLLLKSNIQRFKVHI